MTSKKRDISLLGSSPRKPLRVCARQSVRVLKTDWWRCLPATLLSLSVAPEVQAHADQPPTPHDLWHSWNLELWLLALLALGVGLYLHGLRRLWTRAGSFRGISSLQLGSFAAGMLLLLIALISPVDAMGEALSSAHMVQHMLLLFSAPLLVLAAPLPVYLWALPRRWRRRLGSESKQRWIALPRALLTSPFVAWLGFALALWLWHVPSFYQAALKDPLIHEFEHFSFFATALLFWWVVFRGAPRTSALAMLFTTMLHGGALAALMTFSSRSWYPVYHTTTAWGLTPLEDQHLAGLLMWVPGSIGYLLAALVLVAAWLQKHEVQASHASAPHASDALGIFKNR